MAIAVTQGHVQRAIDFYNKVGKYFIIGGTSTIDGFEWDDPNNPTPPSSEDYKLKNVIGLKKVDRIYLVVKDETSEDIKHRNQNYRIVQLPFSTTNESNIVAGTNVITVNSTAGFSVNSKIRINSEYTSTVTNVNETLRQITIKDTFDKTIPSNSRIEGGALVEGAKYVYVDCNLYYNDFPLSDFRQIGLCTEVLPNNVSVLRSAKFSGTGSDEYESLGVLEVLDNRPSSTRDVDTRELLSLILEF